MLSRAHFVRLSRQGVGGVNLELASGDSILRFGAAVAQVLDVALSAKQRGQQGHDQHYFGHDAHG